MMAFPVSLKKLNAVDYIITVYNGKETKECILYKERRRKKKQFSKQEIKFFVMSQIKISE